MCGLVQTDKVAGGEVACGVDGGQERLPGRQITGDFRRPKNVGGGGVFGAGDRQVAAGLGRRDGGNAGLPGMEREGVFE